MGSPVLDLPSKVEDAAHELTAVPFLEPTDSLDMADGFLKGMLLGGVLWFLLLLLPLIVYMLW